MFVAVWLALLSAASHAFVTKPFDEIKALTTNVITFFGSSSELSDEQRQVIDSVASTYNETYFVDKEDPSNKQIFGTPDLKTLPVLYVLTYEEMNAERYTGEFTSDSILEFIRYKYAPYNESLMNPDATMSQIKEAVDSGIHVGAAVFFVSEKKCAACPSTAITMLRSATRLHANNVSVQFYALNCDKMLKDCGSVYINRVPTFAIYSHGIWTQYTGGQIGRDIDAFVQKEIEANEETLKRRKEAQDKDKRRFDEELKKTEENMRKAKEGQEGAGTATPNTATRTRMLSLEKRVAALEKKLEKALEKGRKNKDTKKEL